MALAHYTGYIESTSTGKALPDAVVRVYSYPGNVLQATFADPAGTPRGVVESQDNGEYDFYISDGAYNLEYVYNGVVLNRITNVAIYNPVNALPVSDLVALADAPVTRGSAINLSNRTLYYATNTDESSNILAILSTRSPGWYWVPQQIGSNSVLTESGTLEDSLAQIQAALNSSQMAPEPKSASDAAEARRDIGAADVQALNSCLLNINGTQRVSQEVGAVEQTGIGSASPGTQKWMTDGHKLWVQGTARVKSQQVSIADLPGFSHALRVEVTTAQSAIGTDFIRLMTFCAADDFTAMAWGTLKARDLIVYKWVKTNFAGTFEANILNGDRTIAVPAIFTVSEPSSWQFVKMHFRAPTFTSNWAIGGIGYRLEINLAGGTSPNLAAVSGNFFMMTGKADIPADYDPGLTDTAPIMPTLSANLTQCQRFYQKSYNMSTVPGSVASGGSLLRITDATASFHSIGQVRFAAPMAGIPAVTVYSPSSGATGMGFDANAPGDVALTIDAAGANGFNAFINGVSVAALHSISFQYTADVRIG